MTREELLNVLTYIVSKCDNMILDGKYGDILEPQSPLPSNLDEAAEEFASNAWLHGSVWHEAQRQTFKAGAEWMAGQEEIIEGEVVSTSTNDWECIRINKKLHSVGDKVTIQIRKK